jgi:hypothetical protein
VISAFRRSARLRRAPLEEQLFSLIHSQLEYLAPHETFIGTALAHALQRGSRLGPFNMKAQESGLYQTLYRLGARVRTTEIVRKYLKGRRSAER